MSWFKRDFDFGINFGLRSNIAQKHGVELYSRFSLLKQKDDYKYALNEQTAILTNFKAKQPYQVGLRYTYSFWVMSEIPLCALYLLALIAQERQMNEALAIVEKEISLNLEAQQEARKAEQEADEAEVWAQGLKNLRKSMELRYKQMNKN